MEVYWNKPIEIEGEQVHVSKDGRFSISRRLFEGAPGYAFVLEGEGLPRHARMNSTLSEAKAFVRDWKG